MHIHQINLQAHFGGGEVYTAFLCNALSRLGVSTRLYIHPRADFWNKLNLPLDTTLVPIHPITKIASALPISPAWVLGHGPLHQTLINRIKASGGLSTAIAHMPVQGRNPDVFKHHDRIFAVSQWVVDGLIDAHLPVWPQPLYGVANLDRGSDGDKICQRSKYDWDARKGRDRILSWLEPFVAPLMSRPYYVRRDGLTLGIVSRLTPIKQFPLMFEILSPVLSKFPTVNIEIFGSGGYGSVRDLTRMLKPIANKVRFWGHQSAVSSVYRDIDYLLTGLPEKEALGLNVIEAQACGTPVLAPRAPPFTETIVHGKTGYLYTDPRLDDGENFSKLINDLSKNKGTLDPRMAVEHLQKFSFDAFTERLKPIVEWAETRLP
ncbi:MAG: glycosyltransferase family 1 protein [Betaproteobacteria bacterium]|nr:MAG: glycosyltransferase family 1 protein [Betaproteobacteria bacterium]